MRKILNLDGSPAESRKSVEEVTLDPGLRKLANCRSAPDLEALWLRRECDGEDIQIALLIQIVGNIQQLRNEIAVLSGKLSILSKQTDTRIK